MVNPVADAVSAFLHIWSSLPSPLRSVFYVGLVLTALYSLYLILSR